MYRIYRSIFQCGMKVDESKPDFRPEGIVHVYVNGQAVMEDREYKGGKAGKVVLKK